MRPGLNPNGVVSLTIIDLVEHAAFFFGGTSAAARALRDRAFAGLDSAEVFFSGGKIFEIFGNQFGADAFVQKGEDFDSAGDLGGFGADGFADFDFAGGFNGLIQDSDFACFARLGGGGASLEEADGPEPFVHADVVHVFWENVGGKKGKIEGKSMSPGKLECRHGRSPLVMVRHAYTHRRKRVVRKSRGRRFVPALLTGIGAMTGVGVGAQELASIEQYKRMSLEELMSQEVTSVSRKAQMFSLAPAAIEVLTQEDIHRYGATTIADTLRIAPGLHVARYIGNGYAISARGFNNAAANKLQVLMDGRQLYTPLFSGVFWEVQDTMLEDLERIEVIRGPGAASWGANAVNGVINIISKSARDTQGTLITGGGGNEEVGFGGIRYGGQMGENTFYRVYTKYRYRDDQIFSSGADAEDFSSHAQGGFRLDSYLRNDNQVTLQGDLYYQEFGSFNRADSENNGGNILGRWTKTFSERSSLQLQTYYDRTDRDVPMQFGETRDTWEVDLQHQLQLGERHDLVWGSSYRVSSDSTSRGRTYEFEPADRTIQRVDLFVQDEIAVIPDKLRFLVGSKFEHNDFTGFELQPTARLSWQPTEHQVLWTAVSRGVRTPSRIEDDVRFRAVPPSSPVLIRGNRAFHSEKVITLEGGYRVHPNRKLTLDWTVFYNRYDDLRTVEPTPPAGIPVTLRNNLEADTYGTEVTGRVQVMEDWRVIASYALLQKEFDYSSRTMDPRGSATEGNDPEHMVTLRSLVDLPYDVQFDQTVRYVDRLPNPHVASYIELDVRLAWQPTENLEVAVIGTSLLDRAHPEFNGGSAAQVEVERSIYGQITWQF